ncbi:MAG: hypothetical protein ACR2NN_08920 [Bryobacteraceae bacterium]
MRRITAVLYIGLVCAAAGTPAHTGNTIGLYHWGGTFSKSMSQGIEQIAALGVRNARVSLSARYYADYNISSTACYQNFSLTDAARLPDVKRAFDNPNIDVIMITAYDGVTFGDCQTHRYLSPRFYTPENTAAIVQEYSDFTLYLYQTYQGTHKRFIISNWEADNDVYCGRAWGYATFQAVRASCDATYALAYGGNATPQDSLEGLKLWFMARQRGILEGRNRAAALGIGGAPRVYFAVEFCMVHALRDAGLKSVLYDVLPFVTFDYASYSAYESINRPDPVASLVADLNLLRDVLGSNSIILGEIGFSPSQLGFDAAIAHTNEVIEAATAWGVSYMFQWHLFNQGTQDDFGLYDCNGQATPFGNYYAGKALNIN